MQSETLRTPKKVHAGTVSWLHDPILGRLWPSDDNDDYDDYHQINDHGDFNDNNDDDVGTGEEEKGGKERRRSGKDEETS